MTLSLRLKPSVLLSLSHSSTLLHYFSYSNRVSQAVQGIEGKGGKGVYVGRVGPQVYQGLLVKEVNLEYQEFQVFHLEINSVLKKLSSSHHFLTGT